MKNLYEQWRDKELPAPFQEQIDTSVKFTQSEEERLFKAGFITAENILKIRIAQGLDDGLKKNSQEYVKKYEIQKEINKELEEENENLKKDKAYFSDNLDKEIAAKLEMQKQINELKREIEERKRYEEKLLRESFRAPQDEPPSDAEDDYPADYYDGDEYSEGL